MLPQEVRFAIIEYHELYPAVREHAHHGDTVALPQCHEALGAYHREQDGRDVA